MAFGPLEILVLLSLGYALALLAISRRRRPGPLPAADNLFFVFLIPCLNEELVIGRTIRSLLAVPDTSFALLVVDDGSDDRTAEIVSRCRSERVWLLRRNGPEARRGKGAALNAALRYLEQADVLAGRRPEDVVVAVFDADGRLEHNALFEVASRFRDPKTGAVQVGVQMRNAKTNLLARLQDFEFVVFTEIFQRARERLGSVGLGGNGQFVRLSALRSLGPAPWTQCLTEDLDLGIRLLLAGWSNAYCPTTCVSQQAVTDLRRWWRQRSRWFQGQLQCWRFIPQIVGSELSLKSRADLVWYLVMPTAILLTPLLPVLLLGGLAALAVVSPHAALEAIADHGLLFAVVYVLTFGSAYVFGVAYWLRERSSLGRSILLAHAFEVYSNLWFVAAWVAVWRLIAGKRGWAKTARLADLSEEPGSA
jgi:cellulose synthase/poly-beta-1,6-N-acetylglucosamine synthase-like glycosyltransferase